MKKPGLVARQLPGSVTAIRRPNIPKYLKYRNSGGVVKHTIALKSVRYLDNFF